MVLLGFYLAYLMMTGVVSRLLLWLVSRPSRRFAAIIGVNLATLLILAGLGFFLGGSKASPSDLFLYRLSVFLLPQMAWLAFDLIWQWSSNEGENEPEKADGLAI